MALRGTDEHSVSADAQALADFSARLETVEGAEASSLKGSIDARLEVVEFLPPGDPEIAELIGKGEGFCRAGLNPYDGDATMARVRAQLTGSAVESFASDVSDVELGDLNLDPDDHTNSIQYAHLYCNTLRAGGVALPAEVEAYFPRAQMSAEDIGLDMSEVS